MKFFGDITTSSIVINQGNSKITVFRITATIAVEINVIKLPTFVNWFAANIATAVCLSEHSIALFINQMFPIGQVTCTPNTHISLMPLTQPREYFTKVGCSRSWHPVALYMPPNLSAKCLSIGRGSCDEVIRSNDSLVTVAQQTLQRPPLPAVTALKSA